MPSEPLRHRWARENLRPASSFPGPARGSFPGPFDGEYEEEVKRLIHAWVEQDKKPKPNADRDERWRIGVADTKALLKAEYEIDVKNGANGHRPTDYEARLEFARTHPEDFPEWQLEDGSLDPQFERSAANRIRTALSRLS